MPRTPAIAALLGALLLMVPAHAAADQAQSMPAVAARDDAAPSDAALAALVRAAIVVRDRAASKRFYVDGLGFRIRYEGDITRPAVASQLGLAPGQSAWFVVLEGAASLHGQPVSGAMVGLLQVDHPALPPMQRPAGAGLATGEAMLAIETDEFEAIERRLRALDAVVLVQPMRSPDGRETEMVVRDPDGVRIHVVERRRAAQTLSRPPIVSGSR